VSVFRLVSENTIEEKIVERAQQKLKLDAMVVQQGRLKDADKVSKEEIMAAVRFGADVVFRSEESTISDEDIDIILERGKAKTQELQDKLKKAEKGDLLNFSLDGGISAQTFEGIDYSDKNLRDHLRMLAASSVGKRERRPPPMNYNPIIVSKKSMVVNNQRIKLPKPLRIPQMEDHHFYNRERLLELGKLEFENYAALRECNQVPPREVMEKHRSLLPPEMAQEKRELLAEGFGHWSRSQYYHFVKACAKFGRDDIASIANDMDMPQEEVGPYSEAFWKYGPTELKSEWDRVVGNIERGEKKLAKQKKLSALLTKFVSTFDNPRDDMVFANKGTAHFALEQDRALLCAVEKHGYGNWDSVREEIRTDSRLKFQHSAQGMTVMAIAKRCDYRMRQMEKELEAREKAIKSRRPPNVVAAQRTIEAIKEMEQWDVQANAALLAGKDPPSLGTLSLEARAETKERLKERAPSIARLREIEVQIQRALKTADETRQSINDSAQYINYSSITLKPAAPAAGSKEEKALPSTKSGIELEAAINSKILAVPPCCQCSSCMDSNTMLCLRRLDVRNRLILEASKVKEKVGPDVVVAKKKSTKKRKVDSVLATVTTLTEQKESGPPKKKKKPSPTASSVGEHRPRVTSQGNKRMQIPDELFPEFCRRISASGTGERMKVINQFVEDHATISVRQVTIRFSEITTRDRPECIPEVKAVKKTGRAFMFYLRPCFYKFLPPSERPPNWEQYALEDEKKYEIDKEAQLLGKSSAKRASSSGTLDDASSKPPASGDDGDETEDDSDPSGKPSSMGDEDSGS
jgi:SLIDE